MEENIIVINRKVAEFTKNFEVSGDVIVPDIKPDILSIIGSNGNAYIYREEVSTGRVRIDGNVDQITVYLSDTGETRSLGNTLNFSESFENSNINDTCFVKSKVVLESIDSKVLNERKVSIEAKLQLKVEVYCKENVSIGINLEGIENSEDLQKLQETIETKTLVGSNRVKTSIKEEIGVDPSYEVAEILKVSVNISNLENKISFNKVLAKADANIKILFLAEDGRIGTVSKTIPVMSFIDLEGVQEGEECNVEYFIRNMLLKVNSNDSHSISCQIDFEVSLEVYENRTIDVIQDIYGLRSNVNFNIASVSVPVNSNNLGEKINISEKIIVEDILNIYDVDTNISILNNNQNNLECELLLKIYYEADSRNGLNVKVVKFPFIVRGIENNNCNFEITKQQLTVNGENVNCEMEILCKAEKENSKEVNMITDVEVSNLDQDEDYKMYMYFVKDGDTIWKIAKQFRVSMDDLIRMNGLENPDKINIGDRIYIMR